MTKASREFAYQMISDEIYNIMTTENLRNIGSCDVANTLVDTIIAILNFDDRFEIMPENVIKCSLDTRTRTRYYYHKRKDCEDVEKVLIVSDYDVLDNQIPRWYIKRGDELLSNNEEQTE